MSSDWRQVRAHRRQAVERLRRRGWSNRRIASSLGVSESTVRNDIKASISAHECAGVEDQENRRGAPDRHVVAQGRNRPGPLTSEERKRRRAAVTFLYQQGYTLEKIGTALGISPSSASGDLRELGLTRRGRRPYKTLREDTPEPIDWRGGSGVGAFLRAGPPERAYQTSRVTADVLHWIEGFNGGDYPNRLAWHVHEARAHGDEQWVTYATETLAEAHTQMGQLLRVLRDEAYRETCMRADLDVRTQSNGPQLRAV
jgi:transposase